MSERESAFCIEEVGSSLSHDDWRDLVGLATEDCEEVEIEAAFELFQIVRVGVEPSFGE